MFSRLTSPISHSPLLTVYCSLFTLFLLLLPTGYWRATATGPQVQVPMFYDAHYLFPRPWTQEQAAPGVPEPFPVSAVYGPNQISQSFIAGADNLSMVEVWLAGERNTAVFITLHNHADLVFAGQITLIHGLDGGWYRLTFPPVKNAIGQTFELRLAAPTATLQQPVTTLTVGGDRLGGAVHLNEYPRPGNLVLRSYSRGWPGRWWLQAVGEHLLPAVFRLRLQQYKPALFKGAAFPVLLGVTAVFTFFFLVFSARPQPAAKWGRGLAWGGAAALSLVLLWQVGNGRFLFPVNTPALQPAAVLPQPNFTTSELRVTNNLIETLWTTERSPEPRFIKTNWANQAAIAVPTESEIHYATTVPLNGRFQAGLLVEGNGTLRFVVRFNGQELHSQIVSASDAISQITIDLAAWGGRAGTLSLATEGVEGESTGQWVNPQILAQHTWLLSDPLPADMPVELTSYRFAETAELVGYTTQTHDGLLDVTLYWRILQKTAESATVFIHVLDETGQIIAQQDLSPVSGTYPVSIWLAGVIIADRHTLPVELENGRFTLAIGLYHPDTFARWPVTDATGLPLADDRVLITLKEN